MAGLWQYIQTVKKNYHISNNHDHAAKEVNHLITTILVDTELIIQKSTGSLNGTIPKGDRKEVIASSMTGIRHSEAH